MARRSTHRQNELISLREAAELCGCPTDVELIPDLIKMWRLHDQTVVWRDGRRYIPRVELDTVRSWVIWWQQWRPRRPKRKRPRR